MTVSPVRARDERIEYLSSSLHCTSFQILKLKMFHLYKRFMQISWHTTGHERAQRCSADSISIWFPYIFASDWTSLSTKQQQQHTLNLRASVSNENVAESTTAIARQIGKFEPWPSSADSELLGLPDLTRACVPASKWRKEFSTHLICLFDRSKRVKSH